MGNLSKHMSDGAWPRNGSCCEQRGTHTPEFALIGIGWVLHFALALPGLGQTCEEPIVQFDEATVYQEETSFIVEVTSSDFNGDGAEDLAIATSNWPEGLVIYENLGDGALVFAYSQLGSSITQGICHADFDADGDVDIALVKGNQTQNAVTVYFNDGSGNFSSMWGVGISDGQFAVDIVCADFDNDDDVDVLTVSLLSNTVNIIWNPGDGHFHSGLNYVFGVANMPRAAAIGDFDQDGDLDIAVVSSEPSTVTIHLNNGDGSFQETAVMLMEETPTALYMVAGLLDDDPFPDLAVGSHFGPVAIMLNDQSANFEVSQVMDVGFYLRDLAAGDIDNDGDTDLVVVPKAMNGQERIDVLLNNGSGSSWTPQELTGWGMEFSEVEALHLADLNGDGLLDVSGKVDAVGSMLFTRMNSSVTCPPADLSGDGVVNAADLALLLGSWGPCPEPCTPGTPIGTCPADFDRDCDVDAADLAFLLGSWG